MLANVDYAAESHCLSAALFSFSLASMLIFVTARSHTM